MCPKIVREITTKTTEIIDKREREKESEMGILRRERKHADVCVRARGTGRILQFALCNKLEVNWLFWSICSDLPLPPFPTFL